MASQSFAQEPLPEIIPVEPPVSDTNNLAPELVENRDITDDELLNTPTFMFKPGDHEKVIKIFNSYRQRRKNSASQTPGKTDENLDDMLSKFNQQEDDKPTKVPAYFYLDSIIYQKGKGSKIWVNGKQMSVGQEFNDLKLVAADMEHAQFAWKVPGTGIDIGEWKTKAEKPVKKSESKVSVDPQTGVITFTLKTNQWLDVTKMIVVEGRTMSRLGILEEDLQYYDPAKHTVEEKITETGKPVAAEPEVEPKVPAQEKEKTPEPAAAIDADSKISGPIKESFPLGVDKHYSALVEINGTKDVFKIDTGASSTSIPKSTAKTMGIDLSKLKYDQTVDTAGGKIKVASTVVKQIKVGKLTVKDLKVWVFDDKNLVFPLLGQDFLTQFDSETKNGVLTLSKEASPAQ